MSNFLESLERLPELAEIIEDPAEISRRNFLLSLSLLYLPFMQNPEQDNIPLNKNHHYQQLTEVLSKPYLPKADDNQLTVCQMGINKVSFETLNIGEENSAESADSSADHIKSLREKVEELRDLETLETKDNIRYVFASPPDLSVLSYRKPWAIYANFDKPPFPKFQLFETYFKYPWTIVSNNRFPKGVVAIVPAGSQVNAYHANTKYPLPCLEVYGPTTSDNFILGLILQNRASIGVNNLGLRSIGAISSSLPYQEPIPYETQQLYPPPPPIGVNFKNTVFYYYGIHQQALPAIQVRRR